MPDEQPLTPRGSKISPQGKKQTPDDSLSRALEYDPGPSLVRRKAVTAPLKPLQRTVQQHSRSPMLMVIAALAILVTIALAVMFSASDGNGDTIEIPVVDSEDSTCTIQAETDTNVRLGPGYEYQRGWILAAGQSRLAEARSGENWFLISKGWIPGDVVLLTTPDSCAQLPEYSSPQIFTEELSLPSAVEALHWNELFGEGFATGVNGWTESSEQGGASLVEGSLVLSTVNVDAEVSAAPTFSPNYQPLENAYYTFDLHWVSGESDAEVVFTFQKVSDAALQLIIGRSGSVRLIDATGTELASEDSVVTVGRQVFGVLHNDEHLTIYINGQEILAATVDDLQPGIYTLALRGTNAEVSISRFVVKVPAPN